MEIMLSELKILGIRLAGLIIITPLFGYLLLIIFDQLQKEWASGERRKRWMVMCWVFLSIAIIGGWLR